MSGQTFPAGPTPADELRDLAERFPVRGKRGHVLGFYVVGHPSRSQIEGPFPTHEEAEQAATKHGARVGWARVQIGYVFTSRGTVVHDPRPIDHTPPAPYQKEETPMTAPTPAASRLRVSVEFGPEVRTADDAAAALRQAADAIANRYDGTTPPPDSGPIRDARGRGVVGTWTLEADEAAA